MKRYTKQQAILAFNHEKILAIRTKIAFTNLCLAYINSGCTLRSVGISMLEYPMRSMSLRFILRYARFACVGFMLDATKEKLA